MKKILLSLSVFCMLSITVLMAQNPIRCASYDYNAQMEANDPSVAIQRQQIEQQIQSLIAANPNYKASSLTVTIPVVFHVLYANATQNITDAKCIAQLNQLNLDYSGNNADTGSCPLIWKSLLANTGIQFCLAQRDPTGNPTNGIIHKATTVSSFGMNGDPVKHNSSGGDDAWPATSYLNIWVCNLGSGLLGYAQFPGGPAANDGVVVHYGTVGSALSPSTFNWGGGTNYNWGRTSTHEVGHWLNLRHINGDATCGNDLVADTPTQDQLHFGCATHPYHVNVCSGSINGEMFMNYMDYVDDDCMVMFTTGQSTRMNAAITSFRSGLVTSLGCLPLGIFYPEAGFNASIYPNPANDYLHIIIDRNKNTDFTIFMNDAIGKEVYRKEISKTSFIHEQINLSEYPEGVYLLTVITKEGTLNKKITLQH